MGEEIVVVNFPYPSPVFPRALGKAVIERQGHDIETDISRTLHVVVPAKDVCAGTGLADVARRQQRNATRSNVGGADGVLSLTHAPDQSRGLLRGKHIRDAFELLAGHTADALDFFGCPLVDFLTRLLEAIDALLDELLIFPAVLKYVPKHAPQNRDVSAGPDANIFIRMSGSAR